MITRRIPKAPIAVVALAAALLVVTPAEAKWRSAPAGQTGDPALDMLSQTADSAPAAPSLLPTLRGDLPPWQRTLYKTITFQAVANATDLLLFDTLIGGHPLMLGGFAVANAATAAGLYYGFEFLWQREGPALETTTETTLVKKSLLFQAVNGGRVFLLGYALGAGAPAAALLAGSIFVTDSVVYYGNEYVWDILRPMENGAAQNPITASSVPVSYR